jgi:hypothetical protein
MFAKCGHTWGLQILSFSGSLVQWQQSKAPPEKGAQDFFMFPPGFEPRASSPLEQCLWTSTWTSAVRAGQLIKSDSHSLPTHARAFAWPTALACSRQLCVASRCRSSSRPRTHATISGNLGGMISRCALGLPRMRTGLGEGMRQGSCTGF